MRYNDAENKSEQGEFYEHTLVQKIDVQCTQYIINLDSEITEPKFYRTAFSALKQATCLDVVRLVINSPGGNVDTAIQFISELVDTEAKTIAEIVSAYSSASLIALACDEIVLKDFSTMMVHTVSFTATGKTCEVQGQTEFMKRQNLEIMREMYTGFLSAPELQKMLKGEDFWFTKQDVEDRLRNWKPYRERRTEALNGKRKTTKSTR